MDRKLWFGAGKAYMVLIKSEIQYSCFYFAGVKFLKKYHAVLQIRHQTKFK